MENYNVVRTDNWIMALPSDWEQKQTADSSSVYFESGDGTKGLYISTWSLGAEDSRSPEEVAKSFKANDLKSLQNMQGYRWQVVAETSDSGENSCIAVTDCLAVENSYRTVGKIIAQPPLVVRASFHDYACGDYDASRNYFADLVSSLRFHTLRDGTPTNNEAE
jgi:hypothetical protein